MNHVVALSGGKDSTAMALRLVEVEPRDYRFVCTPTGDEPDEMFIHWNKLGNLLQSRIIPVLNPLGLNGLIAAQNALPNWRQRWCTRILKIEPYRAWLASHAPAVSYVGLRADEEGRAGGIYDDIGGIESRFPLREWGWGLEEVRDYLEHRGVIIPTRTDCDRCFFQTLHEWHSLWARNPGKYAHAEQQEKDTGYTFRSPGRDTQPASLAELRLKFEQGYSPKPRGTALRGATCRACTL
jgi:3'-phosphoadenosine 5'-phosphosulfate sulfotransferase (PAPS reductase)/FAD synthetase